MLNPPEYITKVIGDGWTYSLPETFDAAGEEVTVKTSISNLSNSCRQFIHVCDEDDPSSLCDDREVHMGIVEESNEEMIRNCTITFTLQARGFHDEDPIRERSYEMILEVIGEEVEEPITVLDEYNPFLIAKNGTEASNSTANVTSNITVSNATDLEVNLELTAPIVRKILVNYKGNVTVFFSK